MPTEQKKKYMFIIVGVITAIIFFFWAYEMSNKIKTTLRENKNNNIIMPVDISEIKADLNDINQKIQDTQKLYDKNTAMPEAETQPIIPLAEPIVTPENNSDQELIENMEKALEKIINTTSTPTE